MSERDANALNAAVAQLGALRRLRHPAVLRSPRRSAATVADGAAASAVLSDAGASAPVVEFVRLAAPADLPSALTRLAPALAKHDARTRDFRSAGVYPLVLGLATAALGFITVDWVKPAADIVATAETGVGAPTQGLPLFALAGLVVSVLALGALAMGLFRSGPSFPFRGVRADLECSLILSAASAATHAGSTLPLALRAAAVLATAGPIRDDAEALAQALERGGVSSEGRVLLGELGSAVFAAAAAAGGGEVTLRSLAEGREARLVGAVPAAVTLAEGLSAAIGGTAVAFAGAAFYLTYLSALQPH